MRKSVKWSTYLSSNERFADVINGTCFHGVQIVKAEDLEDKDTHYQAVKDVVEKRANGITYVIIGTESQEKVDYAIALLTYLFGLLKRSKLYPVLTVILYSGAEPWDGPRSLHDVLDLTGLPEEMKYLIPDYRINVIELARLKNTTVFQTDLRQVMDFIKLSYDRNVIKR